MITWQLDCGHWVRDYHESTSVGGTAPCALCNRLHVLIVGMSGSMEMRVERSA